MENEDNTLGKLLPVGSVVYLRNGTIKLVILAIGQLLSSDSGEDELPTFYDYLAGIYPQGFDETHKYYFNQTDIDNVVFTGLSDEESDRYQEVVREWKVDNRSEYKEKESQDLSDEQEQPKGFGF